MLCFATPEAVVRVISCVDLTFGKARFQFVDQVFTTEYPFCLDEK